MYVLIGHDPVPRVAESVAAVVVFVEKDLVVVQAKPFPQ